MGSIFKQKVVMAVAVAFSATVVGPVAEAGGKRGRNRCVQSYCCAPPPHCEVASTYRASPGQVATHGIILPFNTPTTHTQHVYAGFPEPTQIVFHGLRCEVNGTPFTPVKATLEFRIGTTKVGELVDIAPNYYNTSFVVFVHGTITAMSGATDGVAGILVTVEGSNPMTENKTQWYPMKVYFHATTP